MIKDIEQNDSLLEENQIDLIKKQEHQSFIETIDDPQSDVTKRLNNCRKHYDSIVKYSQQIKIEIGKFQRKLNQTRSEKDLEEASKILKDKRRALSEASDQKVQLKKEIQALKSELLQQNTSSDPVQLESDDPIILLPVRLETRFDKKKYEKYESYLEWHRQKFPDFDAQNFDINEYFSPEELEAGRQLWDSIEHLPEDKWKEPLQRFKDAIILPWKEELASYAMMPENSLKIRVYPDGILANDHNPALSQDEIEAGIRLWETKINQENAGADNQQVEIVWDSLVEEFGFARSLFIIKSFEEAKGSVSHDNMSQLSKSPEAPLLPDRWIFVGFQNGEEIFREESAPVIEPLSLFFDLGISDFNLDNTTNLESESDNHSDINDLTSLFQSDTEIAWAYDFEEALQAGMATQLVVSKYDSFKGIDILVFGVKSTLNPSESTDRLESLFESHTYSKGISFIPLGTQTNNSEILSATIDNEEDEKKGSSWEFVKEALIDVKELDSQSDGGRFAQALGIRKELVKVFPNGSSKLDELSKILANLLWPSTIGLLPFLHPEFEDDLGRIKNEFINFVRGQGPYASIRLKNVPYGILPISSVSYLSQFPPIETIPAILNRIKFTPRIGNSKEPLLDLIDVLNQTALSHHLYHSQIEDSESELLLEGLNTIQRFIIELYVATLEIRQPFLPSDKRKLLDALTAGIMFQLLIDGFPPFPREVVKARAESMALEELPDHLESWKAYAESWKEKTNIEKLRTFVEDYREDYAKLILEFFNIKLPPPEILDPLPDIRITPIPKPSISPKFYQFNTDNVIAKNDKIPLTQHSTNGAVNNALQKLVQFINNNYEQANHLYLLYWFILSAINIVEDSAEEVLYQESISNLLKFIEDENLNASVLNKVFVSTLDVCSHRVDSWITSYATRYLENHRNRTNENIGSHVGAYGWLVDLKPDSNLLPEAQSDGGEYVTDSGGYIIAPSMIHASSAAILRSAYLARVNGENLETYAVNLSSSRVRVAQNIIDAIRGGQSLGAVLGYLFERGLHENNLNQYIELFRASFPLAILNDENITEQALESVIAQNVMDGYKLFNTIKGDSSAELITKNDAPHHWEINDLLKKIPQKTKKQINSQVQKIVEAADAVSDLLLSESVYQIVNGNMAGANASLDAISKSGNPPDPQIARVPLGGTSANHRVVLRFDPNAPGQNSAWLKLEETPRAICEPALNGFLGDLLGHPNLIQCLVEYQDNGRIRHQIISLSDLNIQPLDILVLMRFDLHSSEPTEFIVPFNGQTVFDSNIDRRVATAFRQLNKAFEDAPIRINYDYEPNEKGMSFLQLFEIGKKIHGVMSQGKPLLPQNLLAPEDDASLETTDLKVQQNTRRIDAVLKELYRTTSELWEILLPLKITILLQRLTHSFADNSMLLDEFLTEFRELNSYYQASPYNRLKSKINEIDELLPNDSANVYLSTLDNIEEIQRELKGLSTISKNYFPSQSVNQKSVESKLHSLLKLASLYDIQSAFPASNWTGETLLHESQRIYYELVRIILKADFIAEDLADVLRDRDANETLAELPNFQSLTAYSIAKDLADSNLPISGTQSPSTNAPSLELIFESIAEITYSESLAFLNQIEAMSRGIFGRDFLFIPTFVPAHQEELNQAQKAQLGFQNELDAHLKQSKWFAQHARVRKPLDQLRRLILYTSSLGTNLSSVPQFIQLPYEKDAKWIGLEFSEGELPENGRISLAVFSSRPFNRWDAVAGMLLDEWTELIPYATENAGAVFHYDAPSSEAPHAILIATLPESKSQWTFDILSQALMQTLDLSKVRASDSSDYLLRDKQLDWPMIYLTTKPQTSSAFSQHINKSNE